MAVALKLCSKTIEIRTEKEEILLYLYEISYIIAFYNPFPFIEKHLFAKIWRKINLVSK